MIAWEVWGNKATEIQIDKILLQLYARIFGIHIKEDLMKNWLNLQMNKIEQLTSNVDELLRLPRTKDILNQMRYGIKMKSRRNKILALIPNEEKDRVLGFLSKSPSLLTRRYNGYINFEKF